VQQQFFAFKIKNFISPTLALNAAPHGIIVAQLIANTRTAHMPACPHARMPAQRCRRRRRV